MLQRVRPDVVLLNEFDYVENYRAVDLFRSNYLERSQQGARPIRYPYAFTAPSNTGIPTGFDLDRNGTVGGGNDAYGFGEFPGQFGMVVLSRYPIDHDRVRTFQMFRWADMPGALLPDDPATAAPADWYSPEILEVFRLSSKSHWDVPVRVGRKTVHVLASHPTPPTFDGPEDRNGTRNHDEIRFWADYVTPGAGALHLRRRGPSRRAAARVPVRHRGRPERRPAGRGLGGRRRSTSCWTPGGSAIRCPPRPARWRRRSCRAAPTWPTGATRVRHRRLQRQPGAGQPAGRLRPAVALGPEGEGLWSVLAGPQRPAVPAHRGVPVPDQRPPAGLGGPAR